MYIVRKATGRATKTIPGGMTIRGRDRAENVKPPPSFGRYHPRGLGVRPRGPNELSEQERCSPPGRRYRTPASAPAPRRPQKEVRLLFTSWTNARHCTCRSRRKTQPSPRPRNTSIVQSSSSLPRRSPGAGLTQAARPGPAAAVAGRRQPGERGWWWGGLGRAPQNAAARPYRHRPAAGPRERDFPVPAGARTGSTFRA